ncbi:MAG TPA: sigma-70 family RNA polymerase sigma factor [Terriglobales bacterium]|nr:sigma-70 family RNA polymerase sigma factor [Terriglobales bacterium]
MAHLQAGHTSALAVLFDRYHRLIFNIALKFVRDVGEAEDVMQAVFLEIFQVAAQFDPERGTTRVWMLQYAYHRSITRRQQLAARKFYDSVELDEAKDALLQPGDVLVASQETRELVAKGLASLTAAQRRVLELAYFEGLSMREIADRTGESLPNVRHHYYRGLAKIRSVLRHEGSVTTQMVHKGAANARA